MQIQSLNRFGFFQIWAANYAKKANYEDSCGFQADSQPCEESELCELSPGLSSQVRIVRELSNQPQTRASIESSHISHSSHVGSENYFTGFTSGALPCYISRKPRGPVLQNTLSEAVATSTVKRGFVSSKFWGLVRLCRALMVTGEMGLSVRTPARLRTCFEHLVHLMCFKTQTVGSLIPEGTQTMTAITQQASRAATSSPTTGTIPAAHITDVLAAFNAANMAASYIERGSFAAARRKLTQALASINQIKLEG